MNRFYLVFLLIFAAISPALARDSVASRTLDFREATLRLLVEPPKASDTLLRGGVEVRLMPGFKTYWRNPGDSGVPPVFDFSASKGISGVQVSFPMPTHFDDGAGGMAWGYKQHVIFPFTAQIGPGNLLVALKIDFAVCGTMCIPLVGEIQLDLAKALPVSLEEGQALYAARQSVPAVLSEEQARAMIRAIRLPGEKPLWRLEFTSAIKINAAFLEANGYLQAQPPVKITDHQLHIRVEGQASPGTGGRFGPVRLTFGTIKHAYETVIDLDGAPSAP